MDATLEAVVFDFDGLVLDTEWCEWVTAAAMFTAQGTELSLDLWKTFIGSLEHPHWTDILEEQLGRPIDRSALRAERLVLQGDCNADLAPLPGVVRLIDELVAVDTPLAVASSSSAKWVHGHLGGHGLFDRFSTVATGDEVPRTKPDPAVYLLACERLGVSPGSAVAIEDSVNGVAAAKAAGMVAVAVPGTLTRGMDFSAADLVVDSCVDLTPARLAALF